MDYRANDFEMQVARIPTSRSPTAREMPNGVTDSRGKEYSIVITPPRSLIAPLPTIITACLPDGGDFIFLELEVLLLLRNALVTNKLNV
jgi:hypothetical protein